VAKLLVVPPIDVLPAFTAPHRASRKVESTWIEPHVEYAESAMFATEAASDPDTSFWSDSLSREIAMPSWRDDLDARQRALEAFAKRYMTRAPRAEAALFTAELLFEGEAPAEAPFQVLEGLGVLIIDEEFVDRKTLLAEGARIYEDVLVELISPVADDLAEQATGAAIAGEELPAEVWHLTTINIAAAQGRGLTGKGVIIGVLDTGIDVSHPDLADVLAGPDAFAEFNEKGELVTTTPHEAKPDATHGTHVCGLLAGKRTGVAPGVRLAVAAVLTTKTARGYGGALTKISTGLNWLITTRFDGEDVDLINLSLGSMPYQDYLYHMTKQGRDRGVVMVAAIGNGGKDGANRHTSPANYDITVGVGATDASDAAAYFSDWGTVSQHAGRAKPDLCAPGVKVWSCISGGGYGPMNGTSMATPLVTGTAALLIEQREEFRNDPDGLVGALFALVKPATPPPRVGRGRLDLTAI
jgi:subtilisin family serine protease